MPEAGDPGTLSDGFTQAGDRRSRGLSAMIARRARLKQGAFEPGLLSWPGHSPVEQFRSLSSGKYNIFKSCFSSFCQSVLEFYNKPGLAEKIGNGRFGLVAHLDNYRS
jgi:hypothetical protein